MPMRDLSDDGSLSANAIHSQLEWTSVLAPAEQPLLEQPVWPVFQRICIQLKWKTNHSLGVPEWQPAEGLGGIRANFC
jgi:hypothetical protein